MTFILRIISVRNKSELRKEALQKRNMMLSDDKDKASAIIAKRLFSLNEWKEAERIFLYFGCNGEVKTEKIIKEALDSGRQVFLPRVKSDTDMVFIKIGSKDKDMEYGVFGIPEPPDRGEYATAPPDIIVVPCVASDEAGHRIGHGKGYYDRYLKQCAGAIKICPAYECQITDTFIPEDTDINMDIIITEERVIRTG